MTVANFSAAKTNNRNRLHNSTNTHLFRFCLSVESFFNNDVNKLNKYSFSGVFCSVTRFHYITVAMTCLIYHSNKYRDRDLVNLVEL